MPQKLGGLQREQKFLAIQLLGKRGQLKRLLGALTQKKTHISTFVGFAPVKNPKFVLLVVIDEPEYKYIPGVGKNHQGGLCCAPAFAQIGLRTLQYLGVFPDDPNNKNWEDKIEQLKKLEESWNH